MKVVQQLTFITLFIGGIFVFYKFSKKLSKTSRVKRFSRAVKNAASWAAIVTNMVGISATYGIDESVQTVQVYQEQD